MLPGIGLALEPPDPGILESKPVPTGTPLVDPAETGRLPREASLLASGALMAALVGAARHGRDAAQTQTMTFGSLTCAQLLHVLTCRSQAGQAPPLSRNPVLGRILAGSFLAQGAALLVPGVRGLLGVAPIGIVDGLVMVAGGVGPFLAAQALNTGRDDELHFRRAPPRAALCGGQQRRRRSRSPAICWAELCDQDANEGPDSPFEAPLQKLCLELPSERGEGELDDEGVEVQPAPLSFAARPHRARRFYGPPRRLCDQAQAQEWIVDGGEIKVPLAADDDAGRAWVDLDPEHLGVQRQCSLK
ncbi:cation transporting ATPase C-terminal domain-containing protein [Methylobacterium sp. P31]